MMQTVSRRRGGSEPPPTHPTRMSRLRDPVDQQGSLLCFSQWSSEVCLSRGKRLPRFPIFHSHALSDSRGKGPRSVAGEIAGKGYHPKGLCDQKVAAI